MKIHISRANVKDAKYKNTNQVNLIFLRSKASIVSIKSSESYILLDCQTFKNEK